MNLTFHQWSSGKVPVAKRGKQNVAQEHKREYREWWGHTLTKYIRYLKAAASAAEFIKRKIWILFFYMIFLMILLILYVKSWFLKLFWLIWGTIFLWYGLEMEADILAQLTDVIQQSGGWDLVDKFIFFNFMQSFVYRTMKIITSIQNLTLSMGLNETAWIKMFVLTVVSSRVSIKNNFDI